MTDFRRKEQYQGKAKKIFRARKVLEKIDKVLEAGRKEQQEALQKDIEPHVTAAKAVEAKHNAIYTKKFQTQIAKRQQIESRIEKLERQKAAIAECTFLDVEDKSETDASLRDNPSELKLDEELAAEEDLVEAEEA